MLKRFSLFLLSIVFLLAACSGPSDEGKNAMENGAVADDLFATIPIGDLPAYEVDGYVIVDVREIDEYEAGHIPHAKNVPLSTIQSGDYTLDKSEKYVIICRSGNRSHTASTILHEAGYDVTNVSEGMSSWTGPTE